MMVPRACIPSSLARHPCGGGEADPSARHNNDEKSFTLSRREVRDKKQHGNRIKGQHAEIRSYNIAVTRRRTDETSTGDDHDDPKKNDGEGECCDPIPSPLTVLSWDEGEADNHTDTTADAKGGRQQPQQQQQPLSTEEALNSNNTNLPPSPSTKSTSSSFVDWIEHGISFLPGCGHADSNPFSAFLLLFDSRTASSTPPTTDNNHARDTASKQTKNPLDTGNKTKSIQSPLLPKPVPPSSTNWMGGNNNYNNNKRSTSSSSAAALTAVTTELKTPTRKTPTRKTPAAESSQILTLPNIIRQRSLLSIQSLRSDLSIRSSSQPRTASFPAINEPPMFEISQPSGAGPSSSTPNALHTAPSRDSSLSTSSSSRPDTPAAGGVVHNMSSLPSTTAAGPAAAVDADASTTNSQEKEHDYPALHDLFLDALFEEQRRIQEEKQGGSSANGASSISSTSSSPSRKVGRRKGIFCEEEGNSNTNNGGSLEVVKSSVKHLRASMFGSLTSPPEEQEEKSNQGEQQQQHDKKKRRKSKALTKTTTHKKDTDNEEDGITTATTSSSALASLYSFSSSYSTAAASMITAQRRNVTSSVPDTKSKRKLLKKRPTLRRLSASKRLLSISTRRKSTRALNNIAASLTSHDEISSSLSSGGNIHNNNNISRRTSLSRKRRSISIRTLGLPSLSSRLVPSASITAAISSASSSHHHHRRLSSLTSLSTTSSAFTTSSSSRRSLSFLFVDLPPSANFVSVECQLQKDKGRGEIPGNAITSRGRAETLNKLREKVDILCQVSCSASRQQQQQQNTNSNKRRRGFHMGGGHHNNSTNTNNNGGGGGGGGGARGIITGTATSGAQMKRHDAILTTIASTYRETRSMIELKMGFITMKYGILLRWNVKNLVPLHRTGSSSSSNNKKSSEHGKENTSAIHITNIAAGKGGGGGTSVENATTTFISAAADTGMSKKGGATNANTNTAAGNDAIVNNNNNNNANKKRIKTVPQIDLIVLRKNCHDSFMVGAVTASGGGGSGNKASALKRKNNNNTTSSLLSSKLKSSPSRPPLSRWRKSFRFSTIHEDSIEVKQGEGIFSTQKLSDTSNHDNNNDCGDGDDGVVTVGETAGCADGGGGGASTQTKTAALSSSSSSSSSSLSSRSHTPTTAASSTQTSITVKDQGGNGNSNRALMALSSTLGLTLGGGRGGGGGGGALTTSNSMRRALVRRWGSGRNNSSSSIKVESDPNEKMDNTDAIVGIMPVPPYRVPRPDTFPPSTLYVSVLNVSGFSLSGMRDNIVGNGGGDDDDGSNNNSNGGGGGSSGRRFRTIQWMTMGSTATSITSAMTRTATVEGRAQDNPSDSRSYNHYVRLILGNESYETRVMASTGENSEGTSTSGIASRDDSGLSSLSSSCLDRFRFEAKPTYLGTNDHLKIEVRDHKKRRRRSPVLLRPDRVLGVAYIPLASVMVRDDMDCVDKDKCCTDSVTGGDSGSGGGNNGSNHNNITGTVMGNKKKPRTRREIITVPCMMKNGSDVSQQGSITLSVVHCSKYGVWLQRELDVRKRELKELEKYEKGG